MVQGQQSTVDSTWLSALLTQVLLERESERRTIAHTLQEDVGQVLAALALHLRMAENACETPQCRSSIAEARTLAGEVLHRIEQLTRQLYPPALENQGLGPALEILAKDLAHTAQVRIELDLEVLPARPPAGVELAMFRIAQEALENIVCHAYASNARLILREADNTLYLVVEDDGVGYTPAALSGWGVLRMTQRAAALGGSCQFHSAPGAGTRVMVALPVKEQMTT